MNERANMEMNEKKSSSLPYEVRVRKEGEEKSAKDYDSTIRNKKRIEAIIPSEKTDSVLSTLESMNIQATFYESKGMGKGEKYDTPMNEVSEKGSIIANKFEGPMAGKQMSDLVKAGVEGMLYLNIHTEQNPNGEIRGQIGSPIIP